MDFEKAVSLISTVTDLRRIASAHVIDHNQLKGDELRAALVKSKPQYCAAETVAKALDELLSREPKDTLRALNRILLVDVLLDQYRCFLPFEERTPRSSQNPTPTNTPSCTISTMGKK